MELDHLAADLATHHIEGLALQGYAWFRVPLVSRIDGNLWMGGCRDGVRLPDGFARVVSLWPQGRYHLGPATTRVEVSVADSEVVPPAGLLVPLAEHVLTHARQGPTLVHCQAGLNRSGLVAALALILDGMLPAAAIDLLRQQRSPAVLCNPAFERWLLESAEQALQEGTRAAGTRTGTTPPGPSD